MSADERTTHLNKDGLPYPSYMYLPYGENYVRAGYLYILHRIHELRDDEAMQLVGYIALERGWNLEKFTPEMFINPHKDDNDEESE